MKKLRSWVKVAICVIILIGCIVSLKLLDKHEYDKACSQGKCEIRYDFYGEEYYAEH